MRFCILEDGVPPDGDRLQALSAILPTPKL